MIRRTLALALLPACMGPWRSEWDPNDTAPAAVDSAPPTVIDTDDTPGPTGPVEVVVSGSITGDTVWDAATSWVLDGLVFVEAGTLTIEPGATIRGGPGSALIVTEAADLIAVGSKTAPIVFTSDQPVGARARGDWGGLVLLGDAPINVAEGHVEGVDDEDPRGFYGGTDPGSTCGKLEYVRIEFVGFEISLDNELNGLTLAGCGSGTIVRNVQVHMTLDDGVELFGGTVDLQKVVVTRPGDDAVDWDEGWSGRVQFLIVQQDGDDGDSGFESDSKYDALPRSAPTIYNATLIGSREPTIAQRGMLLREGTAGVLRNFLLTGFTLEAVDVRDAETVAQAESGALTLTHSIFYDIGVDQVTWAGDESADDDDGGFDEALWLADPVHANRLGTNPLLPAAAFDLAAPDFVPLGSSPANTGAAVPPQDEFWDQAATFVGAVRPGETSPWYAGWTAFPVD